MSIKEIAGVVGSFFYVSLFLEFHSLKMKCLGPTGILNLEEQRDVLYVIGGADPLGPLISIKAIPRKSIYLAIYLITNTHKNHKNYGGSRKLNIDKRNEASKWAKLCT